MLTGVLGRYPHTAALLGAPLALAGARLAFAEGFTGRTARAMIRDLAYDVAELPVVNYLAARERGAAFSALPVFLTRRFPQPMLVVSRRSRVRTPADLAGGRVGIGYYGNTDTAWVQVMLAEQFGVDCAAITWVASQGPQVPRPVPPNVTLLGATTASAATDALPSPALGAMLAAGELDAVVYGVPRWEAAGQDLAPLLDPAAGHVDDWVARTGVFPPLHTLVIADRVIDAHPGLPAALFAALDSARRTALAGPAGALAGPGTAPAAPGTGETGQSRGPDPSLAAAALHSGFPLPDRSNVHPGLGVDPVPYGLAANLAGLTLLARHAARLGLLDREPDPRTAFLDVAS